MKLSGAACYNQVPGPCTSNPAAPTAEANPPLVPSKRGCVLAATPAAKALLACEASVLSEAKLWSPPDPEPNSQSSKLQDRHSYPAEHEKDRRAAKQHATAGSRNIPKRNFQKLTVHPKFLLVAARLRAGCWEKQSSRKPLAASLSDFMSSGLCPNSLNLTNLCRAVDLSLTMLRTAFQKSPVVRK